MWYRQILTLLTSSQLLHQRPPRPIFCCSSAEECTYAHPQLKPSDRIGLASSWHLNIAALPTKPNHQHPGAQELAFQYYSYFLNRPFFVFIHSLLTLLSLSRFLPLLVWCVSELLYYLPLLVLLNHDSDHAVGLTLPSTNDCVHSPSSTFKVCARVCLVRHQPCCAAAPKSQLWCLRWCGAGKSICRILVIHAT